MSARFLPNRLVFTPSGPFLASLPALFSCVFLPLSVASIENGKTSHGNLSHCDAKGGHVGKLIFANHRVLFAKINLGPILLKWSSPFVYTCCVFLCASTHITSCMGYLL